MTKAPVFSDTMPIVRRKGKRFRRFDPVTARMSPWFSDAPTGADQFARVVSDTFNANATGGNVYGKMRKAELQELARTRGIKFNTKTTAAALREALSA